MNKEIIYGGYEDFVSKLYEVIEEVAKENHGIQLCISFNDCKKWAEEHITWIEIY